MSGSRPSIFRPHLELETSAFLLAAIGCLGIVTQLVLLRELMAAYGGNELSAGVTVAAWILCEAIGAWLAGNARPSLVANRSSSLAAVSILFSIAAVPAAVLIRPALGILPGEALSIPLLLAATIAVVFLPAASHGALFVTAAGHRPQGIGSAYVWEGAGTVIAGFTCFFLLNRLPSVSVVALSALPLVAAQFVGQVSTRTRWALGPVALVSLTALVLGLPVEKLAWGAAWKGQRVVAVENSHYGKIVRLEREDQQLILYDGLSTLTVPTTAAERVEELALLPVLCYPVPRRVLVLGTDLAIPIALARFLPDLEVTTVQLDPLLTRAAITALSTDFSSLPSFSLITADPVSYLRNAQGSFDCIILTDDAPASLVSSRLFSAEFYRLCRWHLSPGGLLATAGPGNPVALSPDVAALLSTRLATLRTAFGSVLPVAADFPLIFASNRPLRFTADRVVARLTHLSETPELLDSSYVTSLLDPFRQRSLASFLAPRVPSRTPRPSSLTQPRELFLNMVRENRLVSPAFGALYGRLGDISPSLLLLCVAVVLVVGLVGGLSRGSSFSRGFAILTSGFTGAAVSSVLIFAWQVRFGSVFSGIALLVTGFMLGSVLGAGLGTRRPFVLSFVVSDIALASCAAAVLALMRSGPAVFLVAADCLAGACLGFQFAVAGGIGTSNRQSAVRRAGVLSALDLAGGSLGGVLTALLIVPVFGIATAAMVAGAVKLTSAVAQSVSGRPASRP